MRKQRRVGIWDLLWAPVATVAVLVAIMELRLAGPYILFVLIAGFAATVVEASWWLSQVRRDRRRARSSGTDLL